MLMSAKIVNFDEASHTYTHKDKGKFISVTPCIESSWKRGCVERDGSWDVGERKEQSLW